MMLMPVDLELIQSSVSAFIIVVASTAMSHLEFFKGIFFWLKKQKIYFPLLQFILKWVQNKQSLRQKQLTS